MSSDPLELPRLHGPIGLDGRIGESAWNHARELSLTQHKAAFGAERTEKTEVLIGYTDEYIYVACRCYDRGAPWAYEFNRVRFPDREQAFAAHVGRLRLEVTPNTKLSIQPFVQYSSAVGGRGGEPAHPVQCPGGE